MMDRRAFLGSLALLAAPVAAEAGSQVSLRRIAYLNNDTPCDASDRPNVGFRALLDGLHSLGYREGQNVAIECRSAEGKYERLDTLAAKLVRLNPAVLVASSAPASLAAKRVTSSIPIVSVYAADPVGLGLVASLARPGTSREFLHSRRTTRPSRCNCSRKRRLGHPVRGCSDTRRIRPPRYIDGSSSRLAAPRISSSTLGRSMPAQISRRSCRRCGSEAPMHSS
jgi:hypothetical protein